MARSSSSHYYKGGRISSAGRQRPYSGSTRGSYSGRVTYHDSGTEPLRPPFYGPCETVAEARERLGWLMRRSDSELATWHRGLSHNDPRLQRIVDFMFGRSGADVTPQALGEWLRDQGLDGPRAEGTLAVFGQLCHKVGFGPGSGCR